MRPTLMLGIAQTLRQSSFAGSPPSRSSFRAAGARCSLCALLVASMAILVGCEQRNERVEADSAESSAAEQRAPSDVKRPQATADQLRLRATRYWKSQIGRFDENNKPAGEDFETFFTFITPEQRSAIPYDQWYAYQVENKPFLYTDYTIGAVEVEGRLGWVATEYETRLRRIPQYAAQRADVIERWRFVSGDWYPIPPAAWDSLPAPPSQRDQKAEAELSAFAEKAWAALQAGDWEAVAAQLEPGDTRDAALAEFQETAELREFVSRRVFWVEVIGNEGRISAEYALKLRDPSLSKLPPQSQRAMELWSRVDGRWYRRSAAALGQAATGEQTSTESNQSE